MDWQEHFSFKKLSLKRFPREEGKDYGEEYFWKRFKFPVVVKEYAAVSSVCFAADEPFDYAVTTGSRVQIYSGLTNHVTKTISRFKVSAYSGCFRGDGKLLAAGSEDGAVKIFDVGSRAILRHCRGHQKPTRTVRFSLDGLNMVSGSDDTTLHYWDLPTESSIITLRGHEDYVRSVRNVPSSGNLYVSGSYDHSLKLWDIRSPSAVMSIDHGAPVEAILVFQSGSMCVSAGGQSVKVWDLLGGGRQVVSIHSHSKTVTSLSFDGNCQRLLSGSLDKYVKVHSVENYHVIHSHSYPAPILSLDMSPSDSHLVVGMTNRLLSIKHRVKSTKETNLPMASPSAPRPGTHRYFVRGKHYKPLPEEHVFKEAKKRKFESYEVFLKKFKYKDALSAALGARSHDLKWNLSKNLSNDDMPHDKRKRDAKWTVVVFSLLQDLARRDALSLAISGRNEEELLPLLDFLLKNFLRPGFTDLLLDVCLMVVDVYGGTLWESKMVCRRFRGLNYMIEREMKVQKVALQLLGGLESILTVAMATKRHPIKPFSSSNSSDVAVTIATAQ